MRHYSVHTSSLSLPGHAFRQTPHICCPRFSLLRKYFNCCKQASRSKSSGFSFMAPAGQTAIHLLHEPQSSGDSPSTFKGISVITETYRTREPYFGLTSSIFLPIQPSPAYLPIILCDTGPIMASQSEIWEAWMGRASYPWFCMKPVILRATSSSSMLARL